MGLLIKYAQHINKDIIEKTGEKISDPKKFSRAKNFSSLKELTMYSEESMAKILAKIRNSEIS